MADAGRVLIFAGIVIAIVGGLLVLTGGRLPGTFSFTRGGFSFYFPIGLSLAVSVLATLLLNLLWRAR